MVERDQTETEFRGESVEKWVPVECMSRIYFRQVLK
jgi:hypothetical protein